METTELFTLIAAVIFFLAVLRRSTRRALEQIRDPAIAHRMLNENADAFWNRPSVAMPMVLTSWRRRGQRNENITTAPYGQHWRALRCNITADILHPSRLGVLAPLQREAVGALVADLSAMGAGEVVVIREHLSASVFALATRLCFGDGVEESRVRALQKVMEEFVVAIGEAISFDGSTLSKVVHWRRLRRLSALLGRQTELLLPIILARRQQYSGRPRDFHGGVRTYLDSLIDLRIPNNDDDDDDDDAADSNNGARRSLRVNEMLALVSEFLGANTGAIVACVEWTLAHIVMQPEVQNKLRLEIVGEVGDGAVTGKSLRGMTYLHATVLESLRMHPPVPVASRGAHSQPPAAGEAATVKQAASLGFLFMLQDIGRDMKMWTDPDEFRPERFLAGGEAEDVGPLPGPNEIRMMPFGAGRRYCPGIGLAMLHLKLFLAVLVREYQWTPVTANHGRGIDLTGIDGFIKVMEKPLRAHIARCT